MTSTPTLSMPEAMLFDLDGTVARTEHIWDAAKSAVAARHGIAWTDGDQARWRHRPTPAYAAEFARRAGVDDARHFAAEITNEVAGRIRREVEWMPGALDLLRLIAGRGASTALVTMAYRPIAEAIRAATGLDVFPVIVAGDDVQHSKPHPEPYLRALQLLGADPRDACAFEDSEVGAESAMAAGLTTWLVGDPRTALRLGARSLDSLADLVP